MVRLIVISSVAFTGLVFGVVFYVIDGIPRDHDKYGTLELTLQQGDLPSKVEDAIKPGQSPADAIKGLEEDIKAKQTTESAKFDLPEGEVRLNWEGTVSSFGGGSRTVSEPPDDMTATVTPAAGGKPLEIEDRGGYESIVGDTGWNSWRSFEVPEEGTYVISIEQPTAEGGAVAVGEGFWKPGGSRVLGAVLVGLLPIAIGLVVLTLIGIISRRR